MGLIELCVFTNSLSFLTEVILDEDIVSKKVNFKKNFLRLSK